MTPLEKAAAEYTAAMNEVTKCDSALDAAGMARRAAEEAWQAARERVSKAANALLNVARGDS